MKHQTQIDCVQEAWDRLAAGELDALAAMYAPDMVLILPGQNDRIEGRVAFRAALDSIGAALPPGFDISSMHSFAAADGVMQIVEWTSTKLPEGTQSAILWRFNAQGKISEERWFVDTEQWKATF